MTPEQVVALVLRRALLLSTGHARTLASGFFSCQAEINELLKFASLPTKSPALVAAIQQFEYKLRSGAQMTVISDEYSIPSTFLRLRCLLTIPTRFDHKIEMSDGSSLTLREATEKGFVHSVGTMWLGTDGESPSLYQPSFASIPDVFQRPSGYLICSMPTVFLASSQSTPNLDSLFPPRAAYAVDAVDSSARLRCSALIPGPERSSSEESRHQNNNEREGEASPVPGIPLQYCTGLFPFGDLPSFVHFDWVDFLQLYLTCFLSNESGCPQSATDWRQRLL
jgi:hypothetical protein